MIGYLPKNNNLMDEKKAFSLNPLVLAFVGDGVHTLAVRTFLAESSDKKAGELHKDCVAEVKARSQCVMGKRIEQFLTEREHDVFRRARNTKMVTMAKHATVEEYRYASAFEAVVGYLYLIGDEARLQYVFEKANDESILINSEEKI